MPAMQAKVFLDAVYAIALSSPNDQFHEEALVLASELQAAQSRLVTTEAVILEIGNSLSKQQYRLAGVRLIASLLADPNVEIVPSSPDLFARAFRLYAQRADKEWGLTDCISFVVMSNYGISEALTADEHFRQAGYKPLLLQA
jgi:uncharacterized protein